MNETIHYISPFTYIRDVKKLKSHIAYITRTKAKPQSTLFVNNKIDTWMERAQYEKSKRHDSVIALQFVLALPNDKLNDKQFYSRVGNFLATFFNIDPDNVDMTIHRDNPENLHMHVLIYPRDTNNKKLRINKRDLARFHREWDAFLKQEGYIVRKDDLEDKLTHIGYKLYKDPTVRESYNAYKNNKKQKRQLQENISFIDKKIRDIDNKIYSIQQRIEQQKVRQKKIKRYKIKKINRRFIFTNILNLIRARREIQKIEKQEREAREKLLLMDAMLHQLQEQKQRLEQEKEKKEQIIKDKQTVKDKQENKVIDTKKQPDTKPIDEKLEQIKKTTEEIERKRQEAIQRRQNNINNQNQQTISQKKPINTINQTSREAINQNISKPTNTNTNQEAIQQNNKQINTSVTLTDQEKKIRNQIFGDNVYTYTKTQKTIQTPKEEKRDQTEADIKNILFGIEPEQTQEEPKEEKKDEKPNISYTDLANLYPDL